MVPGKKIKNRFLDLVCKKRRLAKADLRDEKCKSYYTDLSQFSTQGPRAYGSLDHNRFTGCYI